MSAMHAMWCNAAVLALIATSLAGCSNNDRSKVSGQVLRHDGTPVSAALVTARSNETGKWASGTTDAEGRFELRVADAAEGLEPGDYYVTVAEDLGENGQRPRTIPARYEKPSASGLQLTVKAGEDTTLDLKLEAS
jgi:hypothetical protein